MSDHLKMLYQRAKKAMSCADFVLAKSCFEHILELEPQLGVIHYNLGSCCFELKDFPGAFKHYTLATNFEPDALTYFNLGVVLEKLSQPEQAAQAYEHALSINPSHFESHYNLGVLALANDKDKQALKHLNVAQNMQPDNALITFQLSRLKTGSDVNKPPAAHIQSLFDDYADHFESHLLGELNYQLPTQIHQVVHSLEMSDLASSKILDLGCGTGLVGDLFKNECGSIIGVDLSPKMLEMAKQKKVYSQLHLSDIDDYLKSSKESCDIIIAADVFNYIGALSQTLSLCFKRLSKKGALIFSVEVLKTSNDYALTKAGRYQHNCQHIKHLLAMLGFECEEKHVTARVQNDIPVVLAVFVCIKESA